MIEELRLVLCPEGSELVALGIGETMVRESTMDSLLKQKRILRLLGVVAQVLTVIGFAGNVAMVLFILIMEMMGLKFFKYLGAGLAICLIYFFVAPLFFEFMLTLQVRARAPPFSRGSPCLTREVAAVGRVGLSFRCRDRGRPSRKVSLPKRHYTVEDAGREPRSHTLVVGGVSVERIFL